VELHTFPRLPNDLFDFSRHGASWTAAVRPIYYGGLTFAQAAPAGSRLLRVSSPAPGQVRAWAVRVPGGGVNVVLINDSLTRPAHAVVAVPGPARDATVERLRAPSAYATGGVALGGRSFGSSTSSGVLAAPLTEPVRRRGGGYAVAVPAASAALLAVPAG
jgi:hypothetical protein